MLELLLGQIPEAIFFALFMIYAKNLKEKRVLFILLMIAEYLLAKHTFTYSWLFHISYMIIIFITLKYLYKEKSQITDIFLIIYSYVIMLFLSLVSYIPILIFINNFFVSLIINRILMILFLILFKDKLIILQNFLKKKWNRKKDNKGIKSTTVRCINLVIFNLFFYLINILMIFFINNWL